MLLLPASTPPAGGVLRLPLIKNKKTVNPRDSTTEPVYQLVRLWWRPAAFLLPLLLACCSPCCGRLAPLALPRAPRALAPCRLPPCRLPPSQTPPKALPTLPTPAPRPPSLPPPTPAGDRYGQRHRVL